MQSKTAVIVLNWNGSTMLHRYLPSVVRYSADKDVTIYVVDNGSTDDSVEVVRQEFPTVNLLLFDRNYGFAEGYNRAVEQIEAEYVVLLNSDVEVTPDWLRPLTDYMDIHPDVAACQPKLRSYLKPERFEYAGAAGGFLDRYGYPFCRGRILGMVETDHGQYDSVASVFWASGAALFIRRGDYLGAGGLDKLFFAHMEEIDLCWRLRTRGRRIVCVPRSTVYHLGAATLRRESPQKTFLNFRNNLLMLYKNLPEAELNHVMRMRYWLDRLAIVQYLLRGQPANALAVMRARAAYRELRQLYKVVRADNLCKQLPGRIAERTDYSIIFRFYLQGKRLFSQL
jgi:GT2 family glycosyltransferase